MLAAEDSWTVLGREKHARRYFVAIRIFLMTSNHGSSAEQAGPSTSAGAWGLRHAPYHGQARQERGQRVHWDVARAPAGHSEHIATFVRTTS
ncbi:hypothetical protein MES4922_520006 [Mesorhizobium ventifaucium]|uniref:DUF58 domain-containing protein n=1 Tax=Mesorhizobium ventifaucium TaxID=666020 RepID=A0ABN8KAR8_9HYPH|nr:hypothetical protein MES4922_520006 [Mesorhizobium ventifaucium]